MTLHEATCNDRERHRLCTVTFTSSMKVGLDIIKGGSNLKTLTVEERSSRSQRNGYT